MTLVVDFFFLQQDVVKQATTLIQKVTTDLTKIVVQVTTKVAAFIKDFTEYSVKIAQGMVKLAVRSTSMK